jgi:hypothetical protein
MQTRGVHIVATMYFTKIKYRLRIQRIEYTRT